ncbi:helix-turn-helix domain-containing protein [Streptomyces scabiei]|uniref:helix-turn-helix domain-containing protein n=1 Tax=Streptomyces scabiei TaxID=1930 RepID=UPI00099E61FB|nr:MULTISPECIES: helix-turn-helix domain-containing protein [Streptomyces]MBP5862817.1 helix-turn-helix domain-containing protein [Streptomyces sp. LBUM 1484]MBP5876718.1 helix-turn-helix domain-containing protein [Streptomyces sp. LBUM 1477]MBP5884506.1 helix-turn-helix domain-containing protein [Streptomyces sp. LBUM 1487]
MTNEPEVEWSTRLALSVAREVRRHRQAQGLSAQQLSERCAEVGMPIQRSVLANLESGRRTTVTVAEVLVLARALGVPPGVLIFPVGHVAEFEVLPGAWQEPSVALDWLSGTVSFSQGESEAVAESPLGLVRKHYDLVIEVQSRLWDYENSSARLARERHSINQQGWNVDELQTELEELTFQREMLSQRDAESSGELSSVQQRLRVLEQRNAEARHALAMMEMMEAQARSSERGLAEASHRLVEHRRVMHERDLYLPVLPESIASALQDQSDVKKKSSGSGVNLPAVPASSRPRESVRQLSGQSEEGTVTVTLNPREVTRLVDGIMRDLKKSVLEKLQVDVDEEGL